MKIEVSDDLFSDLAKELETTPENIIKVFLDHAKNLPYSVLSTAIQKTSSLDTALEKLMNNSQSAYLIGDLIQEIIGEREYSIDDSSFNLKDGILWLLIGFLEDDVGELDTVHLQFGSNAVISGTFSINNVLIKKNKNKLMNEINFIVGYENDDEHSTFEIDWDWDDYIPIEISVYTDKIFDLPKISVLEKMAKEIKSTFHKYDERNNLSSR